MSSAAASRTFRLPALTYLVVLFLFFCAAPLAFTAAGVENNAVYGPRMLFLLVPALAAVFIARTATVVDASGLAVRAVLGSRRVSWDDVRGLSVSGRAVYAVLGDGSIRLPCVGVSDLATMSKASGGRLPEMAQATPKYAASRRRR